MWHGRWDVSLQLASATWSIEYAAIINLDRQGAEAFHNSASVRVEEIYMRLFKKEATNFYQSDLNGVPHMRAHIQIHSACT